MASATGRLSAGSAVLVDAHVERCPACTARRRDHEAVAGVLLEQLEPSPLPSGALARALADVAAIAQERPAEGAETGATAGLRATLPSGVAWPRSLHRSTATAWLPVGPGLRWSRVTLAHDSLATVYLMRVAPGKSLPAHSHGGLEMTYVLWGAFDEGAHRFGVGDLEVAKGVTRHQPVAAVEGECICLTSVEGPVNFEGPLAKLMGRLLGL